VTTNGAGPAPPAVVRRLESGSARSLVTLVEAFEELQTVLRCCERLVEELAREEPDPLTVESLWTVALLSYARCFAAGQDGPAALTEADLAEAVPNDQVVPWHGVLTELRGHHADPVANPRERFSVGVSQGPDGTASGIAITSVRQPLVDDLTVRQTGAIAYALSGLVDRRIAEQQERVFGETEALGRDELDGLEAIDVDHDATGS
jgi:hypothetical protein